VTGAGAGTVGVQTSQAINGRLTIGAAVSSTGYHYTTRPIDSTIKLFSQAPYTPKNSNNPLLNGVNTEELQSGSAVVIGADVNGGVLLDSEPTTITTTTTSSN